MPWCPNCKTEYREGITVCADCKTELVAEYKDVLLKNATEMLVKVDSAHQMFTQKLHDFLAYSDIVSVVLNEGDMIGVYVAPEDLKKAKKCFKAFYSVETELVTQRAEEDAFLKGESFEDYFSDDDEEEEDSAVSKLSSEEKEEIEASHPFAEEPQVVEEVKYVSAISKYEDYRSSGYTFVILGGLGIVFALLNFSGVISLFGSAFTSTVLLLIFATFLALGVFSFMKAASLKNAAEIEKRLTEEVKEWMSNNFSDELMASVYEDAGIADETENAELLYLNKVDQLVGMVRKAYPYIHETLAEQLVEEFCNQNSDEI